MSGETRKIRGGSLGATRKVRGGSLGATRNVSIKIHKKTLDNHMNV